ncbi:MAG: hypothetical protein E7645_03605 [Ruminococcaceae bacterium]|nr:hypothetical protein [Oscillospiraceae bacterium]
MKIKTKEMTYEEVMALPKPEHKKPKRPNWLFRTLVRALAMGDLWATHFKHTQDFSNDEDGGPYLILMNHSSFIDLKIASAMLYPKPYCIVSTTDAMVGKAWLMRQIGCIPTQKFVSDLSLIRDMKYALKDKNTSVLMFPEAGYTFDGRTTTLPDNLGGLLKILDVPVLFIDTKGAFARDPLYNMLQLRKVKVTAHMSCILNRRQIKEMSTEELNDIIQKAFSFDQFAWQYEKKIEIKESFRADGLERVLYKCPACGAEGHMKGEGIHITCGACHKSYELTVLGKMKAVEGKTEYDHIPDWYAWQRQCVRQELEAGTYRMEFDVYIGCMVNEKALYMVGNGHLVHDEGGFHLKGCNDTLNYDQSPIASHSLNSDYFWYEIGDVIGIGSKNCLYYCFPTTEGSVTKTRLATEELFKIKMKEKRSAPRRKASAEG